MTLEQLLAIRGNEQFKANPNSIQPNQEVRLRRHEVSSEDKQQQLPHTNVPIENAPMQKAASDEPQQNPQAKETSIHEVKECDTLSAIAQANSKSIEELLSIPSNKQFKDNPNKINVEN